MRSAAITVAKKDLRLLLRDRVALFWVLGFPLLFALFFGAVMTAALERETPSLTLAFVDEDRSAYSERLSAALARDTGLELRARSRQQAARDVQRGDAAAYVRVSQGFGDALLDGGRTRIEIGTEASRRREVAHLGDLIFGVLAKLGDGQSSTEARRRLRFGDQQVEVGFRQIDVLAARGAELPAFALVFPAALLWGLMGCAACFAVGMVNERTSGTLRRLQAAPMSIASVLAGKALACFTSCVAAVSLLMLLAWLGWDLRLQGASGIVLAVSSTAACFAGLMMLLGGLGRSERAVAGAGWATLLVLAMLGGAMVPLSLMPEWLRALSVVSPVRWGIVALEGALWRGFSAQELLLPSAVLLGMGVFGWSAGFLLVGRSR